MRSIWRGVISFGVVSVPIKLYSATESHDVSFHQVHNTDRGRVRYRKVCEDCGETLEVADIVKQHEDGIILTDDDLATLPGQEKIIEVLEFVPRGSLDPMLFESSYYLGIDGKPAAKAYTLLLKALGETDRVAIARFTLRTKTHLAALRVTDKGDALLIHTLRWPDEIRTPEFAPAELEALAKVDVSTKDLAIARTVIESLSTEWNADRYQDTYREELLELIESKNVPPAPKQGHTPPVSCHNSVRPKMVNGKRSTPAEIEEMLTAVTS